MCEINYDDDEPIYGNKKTVVTQDMTYLRLLGNTAISS